MASPMIPPAHAPEFLASCGWQGAEILPLAGDASFRRYFRVVDGDRSAVLMDAPPPHEDPRPVRRGRRMARVGRPQRSGNPRPRPRQGPAAARRFRRLAAARMLDEDPRRERELYELATDVLVHLHQHPPMPGLQAARPRPMAGGIEAVHRLVLPGGRARTVDADGYRAAWTEVLEPVANDGLGPVTVLRDYHAENVMLVDGREGRRAFRPARFPGRARRPPGLRSRLGAGRCAARRAGRDRAGDDRPLYRRDRSWRGVRARLLGARGAAQHAHPRRLHAAVEARRQAALSPLPAAHVGPARARSRSAGLEAGARLVRRQYPARAIGAIRGREPA